MIISRFASNGINWLDPLPIPLSSIDHGFLILTLTFGFPSYCLIFLHQNPENVLDHLSHKLRLLKKDVKVWTKDKSTSHESDSQKIDKDIGDLLSDSSSGILSLAE